MTDDSGVHTAKRRRRHQCRLWIVGLTAGAVTAAGLGTAPAVWASEHVTHHRQALPSSKPGTAVPFHAVTAKAKDPAVAAAKRTAELLKKPVKWATSADVTVQAVATKAAGAKTDTSVSGTGGISVSVASHAAATAAGVDGALMKVVRRASARNTTARVSLDYSGFAYAYGGDFGSRLTLFRLPACALTTPKKAACRKKTPLKTDNNVTSQILTATVPAGGTSTSASTMVVAADTTAKSGAGTYQATSLAPSASWSAGGFSGDFTWSYPLAVPPAAAGPAPDLSIDYDAQSVDGRLPSTNNQPSWIGEGFDLPTSYIERSYDSCDDDGQSGKYDKCWANDNASLVLNGKSTPLIKDTASGVWHPKDDDGERVVRSTGATNGDNDGEYWTVTTQDGTQYVFGKNHLPGWASGDPVTNSTLTVPVYGDDSGEPGYNNGTSFSGRALTQAWRWNLDYVVDTHHNAMSYWYTKETNAYGQNGTTTATGTTYDRGAYLDHIDYGVTDSTFFGTAPDQVKFTTAERCLPVDGGETCSSLTSTTAKDWPDVPFDQICAPGTVCTKNPAPTFFSRKRLTGITTKVWDASLATPAYRDVDSWALDQSFVDPGDGTSASLWLNSIQRTGKDGTAISMPKVTFAGEQLPNRVDTSHDDIAALIKWRVRTITTETGSLITVNYNNNDPTGQCVAGTTMPAAPDNDTLLCYPVMWTPPLMTDPQLDYFNKYVVEQVVESDPTGGAPNKETDYTYANPAWHYDSDNVTSPDKDKTWSVWRGFGLVTTTTGDGQTTRTKSVDTYFQGMDGDKQSDGTTTSATVVDSNGTHVTDSDRLAGQNRETRTFNGSDEVSSTITDQWTHSTGTDGTRTSYYVRPSVVHTRTDRTSGTPRTTTETTTYDPDTGAATQVDDAGDDAVSGDEQCTRTTYADNTTVWLRAAPIDVETVDVACDATTTRPDDVVTDVRSIYDGQSYGTAPTVGDLTSTQRVSSYSGSTPVYQTVSTTTYDSQGRVLSVADADGNSSSTAYTPATGGPLTSAVSTDAKGFTTTTTYDPARNLPLSVVDPNNRRTDYAYDALGRVTSVWLANRSKSVGQTASYTFAYDVSNTAASSVKTGTLNNDGATYTYTYALYDALLRPRQTQAPAPGGGRAITETKYDSRGLAVEADTDYHDATDPSGTLANITSTEPSQTLTTYDGAARPTAADFYADGAYKWSTTTVYGGDRTTVIPPSGGIATTTLTDALGRTTETRQYDSDTGTGTYTSITYGYNAKSQLTKVTDASGNIWTYGYDLMGRKTSTTDPDAGPATSTYTDLDQLASVTDSRGKTISYTYDQLGRKIGEYDAPVAQQTADNQLARWTYDNVAKGQPTSSIRYVGGSGTTGKMYVTQVAAYDVLYRPTTTRFIIPSVTGEESLAGTYSTTYSYNMDGTLYSQTDPAEGGLPSESLISTYNNLGMPTTLKSSTATYVSDTSYSPLGQLWQLTLGATAGPQVEQNNTYEDGTGRLNRQLVTDDTGSGIVQDTHYAYDDAGNPIMVDARANSIDDTQCYQYDGHDRLTQAFTSADTWQTTNPCTTAPTTTTLGSGPAPYWQSYTYDVLGNRKQLTQHATTVGVADTATTYTYGASGGAQPHTLTGSTTTAPGSTTTNSYGYDTAGNTTSRDLNGTTQNLTWDDEGHLGLDQKADGTSVSYLYDANGNRLLARDATGTTLYLGDSEIHLAKGTTSLSGTRYYTYAGQNIAVRTSTGTLQWVLDDAHNTATTEIDPATQAVTFRRTDPFGNDRGTAPTTWTGDHGFVNGVQDTTTDLTHLGARDYDPTTGRFVSLDPVLELTDPQQINGYAYAADNPVTGADPDGLMNAGIELGGGYCNAQCQKGDANTVGHNSVPTARKKRGGGNKVTHWFSGFGHSFTHSAKSFGADLTFNFTLIHDDYKCVTGDCSGLKNDAKKQFSTLAHMAFDATPVGGFLNGLNTLEAIKNGKSAQVAGGLAFTLLTVLVTHRAAEGDVCNFSSATLVLMKDGKAKPIGNIKPGDKVEAADPSTGKHKGPRTVTGTWINHDTDLLDVTVKSPNGKTATIHTTANHPFWDATTHTWVPAGNLTPGDRLNTATDHHASVVSTHATPGAANR